MPSAGAELIITMGYPRQDVGRPRLHDRDDLNLELGKAVARDVSADHRLAMAPTMRQRRC
jgi:hypothetical protein